MFLIKLLISFKEDYKIFLNLNNLKNFIIIDFLQNYYFNLNFMSIHIIIIIIIVEFEDLFIIIKNNIVIGLQFVDCANMQNVYLIIL